MKGVELAGLSGHADDRFRGRHQHGVDDVNDSVAGFNIRRGHRGVVHLNAVTLDLDIDPLPVQGLGGVPLHDVNRGHITSHHVVGKN